MKKSISDREFIIFLIDEIEDFIKHSKLRPIADLAEDIMGKIKQRYKIDTTKEYIICSAIWYNDGVERANLPKNIKTGVVSSGIGHGNCFVPLSMIYPGRDYIINNKNGDVTIQGFITSYGNFVNREEAAQIAYDCNQITEKIDKLHSEDIFFNQKQK